MRPVLLPPPLEPPDDAPLFPLPDEEDEPLSDDPPREREAPELPASEPPLVYPRPFTARPSAALSPSPPSGTTMMIGRL